MSISVTPKGTRGSSLIGRAPLKWIMGVFNNSTIKSYRKSGQAKLSKRMGFPVVLLTTQGAKTGLPRTIPLGGFSDQGNSWLVVASMGGSPRHPAWFLNLAKNPDDVWLEVGHEKFKVRGESLQGKERTDALDRIAAISARYGKYQKKTDREIPIVRLTKEV